MLKVPWDLSKVPGFPYIRYYIKNIQMYKGIEKFLSGAKVNVKSRNWLVVVLLLFLLSNNVHLYEVYNLITGHSGFHVVLILIVLDLSILTFAAYGKRFAAFLFSAVVFATTVTYFFHGPSIRDNPVDHWGFAIIGVLLSLVYATGVYVFTEIFVQKDDEDRLVKRDAMLKAKKEEEQRIEDERKFKVAQGVRKDLRAKIKVLNKDILERENKIKFTPKDKRKTFQDIIDTKKRELHDLEVKLENNKTK